MRALDGKAPSPSRHQSHACSSRRRLRRAHHLLRHAHRVQPIKVPPRPHRELIRVLARAATAQAGAHPRQSSPAAPALWAKLAQQHDDQDRWYLEALGLALDRQHLLSPGASCRAARHRQRACPTTWSLTAAAFSEGDR